MAQQAEKSNPKLGSTVVKLNDGTIIPQIGLGTFDWGHMARFSGKPTEEEKAKLDEVERKAQADFKNAVKTAIRVGYRHIDGAEIYRTSKSIGEALKEMYDAGVCKREDIFITTKNSMRVRTVDGVKAAVDEELKGFGTDYIDLYLMHSAHSNNGGPDAIDVYRTLHELKKEGKIKSVGVSNFTAANIKALIKAGLPPPSINQIETHCFLWETDIIDYCKTLDIKIEAYCPIARANEIATKNELLKQIADKYKKTWAHIMLRWCLQKDCIILPKSVNPKRIAANGDVFDFELTDDEMGKLTELTKANKRCSGWNPWQVWDKVDAEKSNPKLGSTVVKLNDGTTIPQIGLGTFDWGHMARFSGKPTEEEKAKLDEVERKAQADFKNAVKTAIRVGYRHIDGAEIYRTSKSIGEALKEMYDAGVCKREDIFITTKNSMRVRTVDGVKAAVDEELKGFGTDYIDLYLMHSAHSNDGGPDAIGVYRTLHELKKQGKIKSVGVSNFTAANIKALIKAGLPPPSINQIECHCFLWETDIIDYCKTLDIKIEAYCPIARANEIATKNELLKQIAEKYKKTWAHVMLRWCLQKDCIILPKSVNPKRIAANGDIFDFELTADEMAKLTELTKANTRCSGWTPWQVWDKVDGAPSFKVVYYAFGGRAEPLRLAAAIGGIAFEDEFITQAQHAKEKADGKRRWSGPPEIVVYDKDGQEFLTIAQSNACLRYIGELAGLYPKNRVDRAFVDEVLDSVEDLFAPVLKAIRAEDKKAECAELCKEGGTFRYWMDKFVSRLAENEKRGYKNGFFVGDTVTIADLKFTAALAFVMRVVIGADKEKGVLSEQKYKSLLRNSEAVGSNDKVKAFREQFAKNTAAFKENDKVTVFKYGGETIPGSL